MLIIVTRPHLYLAFVLFKMFINPLPSLYKLAPYILAFSVEKYREHMYVRVCDAAIQWGAKTQVQLLPMFANLAFQRGILQNPIHFYDLKNIT